MLHFNRRDLDNPDTNNTDEGGSNMGSMLKILKEITKLGPSIRLDDAKRLRLV